jgi:hypothetical protein
VKHVRALFTGGPFDGEALRVTLQEARDHIWREVARDDEVSHWAMYRRPSSAGEPHTHVVTLNPVEFALLQEENPDTFGRIGRIDKA